MSQNGVAQNVGGLIMLIKTINENSEIVTQQIQDFFSNLTKIFGVVLTLNLIMRSGSGFLFGKILSRGLLCLLAVMI